MASVLWKEGKSEMVHHSEVAKRLESGEWFGDKEASEKKKTTRRTKKVVKSEE